MLCKQNKMQSLKVDTSKDDYGGLGDGVFNSVYDGVCDGMCDVIIWKIKKCEILHTILTKGL